ncbi:hypothetical protein BaRGS_00039821, partial [Batillaria attramentaria]
MTDPDRPLSHQGNCYAGQLKMNRVETSYSGRRAVSTIERQTQASRPVVSVPERRPWSASGNHR